MIKSILGLNSFFMVNKTLVNKLSFESALFIAILADANDVFEEEWIYQTQPTVESLSGGFLTRRKQEAAIKELISHGLIEHKNMGIPRKRYFKLNEDAILDLLKK